MQKRNDVSVSEFEYDINEILGYKLLGMNKVQFECLYCSESGKYEDYNQWVKLSQSLYDDCEYGDNNLLVEYLQLLKPTDTIPLDDIWLMQEALVEAIKEDIDIHSTFPIYVAYDQRTTKCPVMDHDVYDTPKSYREVTSTVYFDKNNKSYGQMHGGKCRDCAILLVHSTKEAGFDPKTMICCSPASPAYACRGLFDKNRACLACGLVCNSCWVAKVTSTAPGQRSRRSRF